MKFGIPIDETIAAFEMIFLILFAVGLLAFVIWMQFQYPQIGLTIAAIGVLLLWLSKMIRKKRDKLIAEKVGVPAVG